jgi:hypothetical protein
MVKSAKGKASLIGSVGGIFIGAAILLFIVSIVLNSLKATSPGLSNAVQNRAAWNQTNSTIASLLGFFTIAIILLGVMGITLVGGSIIGYITGMFG